MANLTAERQRYDAARRNQASMAKVEQLLLDDSLTVLGLGRNLGQQAMGGFLREVVPGLVDKWGNVNAAVAVQYYNEQRLAWRRANPTATATTRGARKQLQQNASRASDRLATAKLKSQIYVATQPVTNALALAEPIIGKGMAKFMGDGFDAMSQTVNNAMTRAVASYNRDAILYNAGLDEAVLSVQRVAEPNACAFCALMAFSSERSVSGAPLDVRTTSYAVDFHNNCRCSLETLYEGDSPIRPDYYDQFESEYIEIYKSNGVKDTLSEWRAATGRS